MMDTRTLIVMNVMFFALYAGVMLVNARIIGGSRGAMWFAGSNLSRGGALLLWAVVGWRLVPLRVTEALSGLLAVAGLMMLHRSFAELLERGPLLRWVQYALLGAMTAATIYLLWRPPDGPVLMVLVCAILGVQGAVIASVVFRFSGEDVGLAGWLTGAALTLYAGINLMQAMVTLRYNTPDYPRAAAAMERVWLVGCLLTNGAVAFGYMFLSAAKVRVELQWRAQVDELTGLLNRWALKRVAMREIQRSGDGAGARFGGADGWGRVLRSAAEYGFSRGGGGGGAASRGGGWAGDPVSGGDGADSGQSWGGVVGAMRTGVAALDGS